MPVRIPLMSSSNVETKAIGGKTTVCGFMNTVQIGERRKAFKRLGFTAILFVIALGSAAAQTLPPPCPSSPNYTDFSSNRNCLALNGSASLLVSPVLQITSNEQSQSGSAWYSTPQAVQNGFTTTFQFQFTNASTPPADGIAFVIQNSSTTAISATGSGGALAYGDSDSSADPSTGAGIPHSLAIEFDTFQNGWDPNVSHVAIQSCGAGPNTSHHNRLCLGGSGANSTLGSPIITGNLADGAVHNVTITYVPSCPTCSPATVANIQVVLNGVSMYPNGVNVDLSSIGLGTGGTAFVGFTGATGADSEDHNILNWMFAPTPQQGSQIDRGTPGSLTQTFVASDTPGHVDIFGFDYSVSNNSDNLTIQGGTTPFVNTAAVTPLDWASIVKGTSMADAPCLTAAGQNVCVVSTLTCTTSSDSTPAGSNCPQSTVRNVLFTQEMDLNLTQPGIVDGILTIPPGYAPGMAMAPDVLVSGAQCHFPTDDPLGTQLCPQSIMTRLEDPTIRGGGTGTTTNSSYVLFCCQPEWHTTPTIPLWSNDINNVPVSFNSLPPATPAPDDNNFHAAQGASVVFGAEPRGTILDTTYPLPAEQSLANPIQCPALGALPTPWSTQIPQAFSVNGTVNSYNDNGTSNQLAEGAYDLHYFSMDCDSFEELVYPATLDIHPGPPGPNVVKFKTVPFNIDTTKPTVDSITLSPPGGYYAQNSVATATVSCTDPSSTQVANFFSGIATCASQTFTGNLPTVTTTPIPLSTSTIGTQTFTANAVDAAGNSTSRSVTYQVVGSTDLSAAMLGNLLVKRGTNMTYYISVVNRGPSTANGVTLMDTLPAGTTFVSSGYTIESCNFSGSVPSCSITAPRTSCGSTAGSCSIGNLGPWTSRNPMGALVAITVHVNTTLVAGTKLTDMAVVSAANSDSNLNNNSTKWVTLVTQ